MEGWTEASRVFRLFAELVDYPGSGTVAAARDCASLLDPLHSEAAGLVRHFAVFAEAAPRARVEESYTRTFELDASHCPYVGYHLFGESYKRSLFMVGLKERYRQLGVPCAGELPDHLGLLLRFLAAGPAADEAQELMREAMIPALDTMLKGGVGARAPKAGQTDGEREERRARPNAYGQVLEALRLWLQAMVPDVRAEPDGDPGERLREPLPVLGSWTGD